MRKRHKPTIKFILAAYFFVLLTASFFIYGVYWYINLPVDEKAEKYRVEKIKRKTDLDKTSTSSSPLILDRREQCHNCHFSKRIQTNN